MSSLVPQGNPPRDGLKRGIPINIKGHKPPPSIELRKLFVLNMTGLNGMLYALVLFARPSTQVWFDLLNPNRPSVPEATGSRRINILSFCFIRLKVPSNIPQKRELLLSAWGVYQGNGMSGTSARALIGAWKGENQRQRV